MNEKNGDGWSSILSTDANKFQKEKCNIISVVTINYLIFISIA